MKLKTFAHALFGWSFITNFHAFFFFLLVAIMHVSTCKLVEKYVLVFGPGIAGEA